jgi:hypothetical protein
VRALRRPQIELLPTVYRPYIPEGSRREAEYRYFLR